MTTPILTREQAAQVLHTTPETITHAIAHRGLPAAKVGRAWLIIEADMIDWLRTQYPNRCASTNAPPAAPGTLTSPRQRAELDVALARPTRHKPAPQRPTLRSVSGAKST